jgi:hypothetical protein
MKADQPEDDLSPEMARSILLLDFPQEIHMRVAALSAKRARAVCPPRSGASLKSTSSLAIISPYFSPKRDGDLGAATSANRVAPGLLSFQFVFLLYLVQLSC